MEKKLAGHFIRMLHAVLNQSWKQHPTKQQQWTHLPPISQTIRDMQGTSARTHKQHSSTESLHFDTPVSTSKDLDMSALC